MDVCLSLSGQATIQGARLGNRSGKAKITLDQARRLATRYRAILAEGRDPLVEDRRGSTLFGPYADAHVDSIKASFRGARTEESWRRSFTRHAASLRNEPVAELSPVKLLTALKPLWQTKPETARILRYRLELVLRAAKADGLRSGDNPATLENLGLPRQRKRGRVRHHPAMAYEQVPSLMAELQSLAEPSSRPLQWLILTATRSAETANVDWSEIDLERGQWVIPAHRVKNGQDHTVPLTEPMLTLLSSLPSAGSKSGRLFPDCGSNTMLNGLKRLRDCAGITVHGFRSSFRDWCGNETAFAREVVEETYGHDASGNDAERAYRRGKAMKKRRQVLEAWNHYVTAEKVVAFPSHETVR